MTGTGPLISWEDLANAVAMCATAQWDPLNHPEWKATLERMAALHDAGPEGTGPPQPEPQEPAGEYAMIELPGYVDHVGWLTDGTRAGQPVIVVSDRDGKKLAEVSPGAYRRIVPLQVPQEPDAPSEVPPDATIALPAAEAYEGYYGDEDDEPADAFPARTETAPF